MIIKTNQFTIKKNEQQVNDIKMSEKDKSKIEIQPKMKGGAEKKLHPIFQHKQNMNEKKAN